MSCPRLLGLRRLAVALAFLGLASATFAALGESRVAALGSAPSTSPEARSLARSGGLDATLDASGTRVRFSGGSVRFQTLSIARETGERVERVSPIGDARELRFERPSGTEWWRATNVGFEQGFTLVDRPSGTGPLVVSIEVRGLTPRRSAADAIVLHDGTGPRLEYSELRVDDSTSRRIAARFEVDSQTIRIVVDDADAVYPLVVDPLISTPTATNPAAFQLAASSQYGAATALSQTFLVVGAPEYDQTSPTAIGNIGRAFVYSIGNATATVLPRATAGRSDESFFGASVAIDGSRVVVGAPYENFAGSGYSNEGAVYIFERPSGSWVQVQRLTAGGGALAGDLFGKSVAVVGDTIAIGAPGRSTDTGIVYTFNRQTNGTWTAGPTISPPTATTQRGFGVSIAMSADTLVVGMQYFANTTAEAVQVYSRSGGVFTHSQTLTASGGTIGDRFGAAVDLEGDAIVVGATGFSSGVGAAYFFERPPGGTFSQVIRVGVAGTQAFGGAVAISGDLALLGASGTDIPSTTNNGRAYAFYRNPVSGIWASILTLPATTPDAYDNFGYSVALDGGLGLIGAIGGDAVQTDGGEATFHRFQLSTSTECRSESATLCEQGFCVDGFCCGSVCGGACNSCSAATGAPANGTCGFRSVSSICRSAVDSCDVAETCDGTATCPADEVIPACVVDAGVDSGVDSGLTDGGSTTTIPKRELSCVCQVGTSRAPSSLIAWGTSLLALAIVSRRARRTARSR